MERSDSGQLLHPGTALSACHRIFICGAKGTAEISVAESDQIRDERLSY